MTLAVDRVNTVPAARESRAFAAIGEAVWWITIVNDTLRNRHAEAYDLALKLTTPSVDDINDMHGRTEGARSAVIHIAEITILCETSVVEASASMPARRAATFSGSLQSKSHNDAFSFGSMAISHLPDR